MKHLPIPHTPARALALGAAALRCPRAATHASRARHGLAWPHARPFTGRRRVLSSSLAAEGEEHASSSGITAHLGSELHAPVPFLSHHRELWAGGRRCCPRSRTPFVRILALDSHRHSYSQPHRLHTVRVRVCIPPPNLAHGGGPRALHRGRPKG